MARDDVGTAKYQSKKLKASGLQKLKYYCQICGKQCRDDNGFKNHLNSPSHRGKVESLSSGAIANYSKQFENDFIKLLKQNHGTKYINANKFYQEYILNDKDHVHLNSTRWRTLTQFIKYLGTNSKVRVENEGDDEEFNLTIRIIDSLPLKTEDNSNDDDEKNREKFLAKQMELGKQKELAMKKEFEKQKEVENQMEQQTPSKSAATVQKPLPTKFVPIKLQKVNKLKKLSVFD